MPGEVFHAIGSAVSTLFGGGGGQLQQQQPIVINNPPTMADPSVEAARLTAVAAAQRAQGRDSTIFTDQSGDTEGRMAALVVRKPNLGT